MVKILSFSHYHSRIRTFLILSSLLMLSEAEDKRDTSVSLQLLNRPDYREILKTGQVVPAEENHEIEILCAALEPQTFTWMRNLSPINEKYLRRINSSSSVLTLPLTKDNDGDRLICRVNFDSVVTNNTTVQLNVTYIPSLKLSISNRNVEEGDRITFTCEVQANPMPEIIQFWNNGNLRNVSTDPTKKSQKLKYEHRFSWNSSGNYTCRASGGGDNEFISSNQIDIQVKHKPVCRADAPTSYPLCPNQTVNISCQVHAHPRPDRYKWECDTCNSKEIENGNLLYTASDEVQTESISCRADNDYGITKCSYTIVPAEVSVCTKNPETEERIAEMCAIYLKNVQKDPTCNPNKPEESFKCNSVCIVVALIVILLSFGAGFGFGACCCRRERLLHGHAPTLETIPMNNT